MFLTILRGGGHLEVSYNEAPLTAKDHYISHYKNILNNKGKFLALGFECFGIGKFENEREREKYFSLVSLKVPALAQVRDPIEILKHGIGRNWECIEKIPTMQRKFNLTFDFTYFRQFLQKKSYKMPTDFEYTKKQTFIYNSLMESLAPKDFVYMDMSEISKERAFDTLCKLSKRFGFNPPKEEDKKIYEAKNLKGNLLFLWSVAPLELYVSSSDIANKFSLKKKGNFNPNIATDSIKILLTRPQISQGQGVVDIMDFKCGIQKDVAIYIAEENLAKLQANKPLWKATREYLKEFIMFLEDQVQKAESQMVTPEMVLEHLRKNKEARESLKSILEPELKHIKKHRADIVESWKHYQEFVKMCK